MTNIIDCTRRSAGLLLAFGLLSASRAALAVPIDLIDHRTAGFVGEAQQGPLNQPVLIESYFQFVAIFGASDAGLANPYLAPSAAAYFANAGTRLYVVRVAASDDASLIGVQGSVPGASTGLQSLREVAEVSVVAIPGATSHAVQAAMIAHAENMPDRIAILDPVSASDINAVGAQRAALSTTQGHAVLYFPWLQASPAGVSQLLPPSGFVAALFARTPRPFSPTGSLVTGTSVSLGLNSTQLGALNTQGISTLRFLSGSGVVVWGARTMASDADWQYITVRRKGSAIASSIEAGTQWALDEPNDVTLWTQLRNDVGSFMQGLFGAGWFAGSSTNQAYFVKCDETTMTSTDIAEGRTVILVGFAPLTAGEFLLQRIVLQRANTTGVVPGETRALMLAPRPSPFRASTSIAFELPAAAPVTLSIHDIAGRTVRTLVSGDVLAAGHHEQVWDGRDVGGASVVAGVYLVRLQAGSQAGTRSVARVQ